jgi:hypothetical protein
MTNQKADALCHRRRDCRLCGSHRLTPVLALTPTPPANAFVGKDDLGETQQTFPLDVFFCEDCTHVQLLDVVSPSVLFENYVYVTGTSPVFVKHFEEYAAFIVERYRPTAGSLVVDIGSNDGTFLNCFRQHGLAIQGIDPAREIAGKASAAGIETIADFFSPALAAEIVAERGKASVVTANNVFAHIDDLGAIANGIQALLDTDGVFVFEVSYLVDVLEKTLFDTIYHEHLAYHNVRPLIGFLARHGLELIGAHRVSSHGGSLRCIAQLTGGPHPREASVDALLALESAMKLDQSRTLKQFSARIDTVKDALTSLLSDLKADGKRIVAFGAPAKATTLMYHFGIGPDIIDVVIDDSPLKQGLFTPGMHIPVVASDALYSNSPDYAVILAWNFAAPIMRAHAKFTEQGGKFIVPLPNLEVH